MYQYDDATQDKHLDACLGITGFFETGSLTPKYDTITGDFDGQALSAGVLQFAAGQGQLARLLKETLNNVDATTANLIFKNYGASVVTNMAAMNATQLMNFCRANFIDQGSKMKSVKPDAATCWRTLLETPGCIAAQRKLAKEIYLSKAYDMIDKFCPWEPTNTRVVAFFFDLAVQSGGMSNSKGSVSPIAQGDPTDHQLAIDMANSNGYTKTGSAWENVTTTDQVACVLLHYAYHRALLAIPQWQWNTLARRGTIAARVGTVNKTWLDFNNKLD